MDDDPWRILERNSLDSILQRAKELKSHLIPVMETLHRHPEVSFLEYETTRYLKEKFVKFGA